MWDDLQRNASANATNEEAQQLRDYFWLNRGPWSMYVFHWKLRCVKRTKARVSLGFNRAP